MVSLNTLTIMEVIVDAAPLFPVSIIISMLAPTVRRHQPTKAKDTMMWSDSILLIQHRTGGHACRQLYFRSQAFWVVD